MKPPKGYIRYELKERMGVRHVPELTFLADRSGRFQSRIEELMSRSRKNAAGKRVEPQQGPVDAKLLPERGALLR